MKKKITGVLLASSMILAMPAAAGCGNSSAGSAAESTVSDSCLLYTSTVKEPLLSHSKIEVLFLYDIVFVFS